jgi:pyruvate kinase
MQRPLLCSENAKVSILKPRARKVKILATLGPASSSPEMIRALMEAGADAFRINMSHGNQDDKAKLVEAIRALEKSLHRPTTILFDLQGPKLRVGSFAGGSAMLTAGQMFVLDRDPTPGDATRVELPHPELFDAVKKDARLLIDDGKVRLRIVGVEDERIAALVEVGG